MPKTKTKLKNVRPRPMGYRSLKDLSGEQIAALLPTGRISNGGHEDPGSELNSDKELCLMEAVAYIRGEKHSDHPKCACPSLTSIGIAFNDSHDDSKKELDDLMEAIPALVGSRTGSGRVRWRRAKEVISLLQSKAVEDLREEYGEAPLENLIEELEGLDLRRKKGAERALEIAELFGDDCQGSAFKTFLEALDVLLAKWDSDGISQKAYEQIMPAELQDIFTTGAEQADVLNALGHIRS